MRIVNSMLSKFHLKKAVAVPLLIALSIAFLFMPLNVASGQIGVSIISIVPPSQSGKAGDPVRILGSITTANGTYKIWFGNNLVVTNTSQGYYVDSSFAVPELPEGNYTITLSDAAANVNATKTFTVLASYSIKALVPSAPAQLQEGSNVVLNITLTGGQSSTTYHANITVMLPTPLSTQYSRVVELITAQTGTAHAVVTYPDPAFQPSGATTNFTGLYHAYFNLSQQLAEDQFFVGFTDSSQYHRGQSVAIHAVGYQPNQAVTMTTTYTKTGATVHSESVAASSEGIINTAWAIPNSALVGDYNITITPQGTAKSIVDSQLFTVSGYPVKFRTLNLAGAPVPQIVVEALDHATNAVYNSTSGDDGATSINLESGNHTISAYWNEVRVGQINVFIAGESTFDLKCELVNLEFVVQDKNGILIPFVNLAISYQYVTTKEGASKTGGTQGQTGISGAFSLNSTLPRISYTVNASLYGVVFNVNNNTVNNVPAQPTFRVTILCPSKILSLKILDYNRVAIAGARVEMVEQASAIFYSTIADNAGTITVEVTFGKYRLRIYTGNVLLNETVVEVLSDTYAEVRCVLYDLQVSVIVVDYFGQPVPNANVLLRGPEKAPRLATTQADGTATFSNLIGGKIQIVAYFNGVEHSYEAVNVQVEAPTAIRINVGKYVLLGPIIIETSLLANLVIILAAVILFLFIEVYTTKKIQPSENES